ncbi:Fungal specific transcription factor domain containing protein [Hyaloscypha variabilis]
MEAHSRRVPLDKRKRTETSCDKCKGRKQKCDRMMGQAQCRYCEIHNIECTTTQPRKKRIYGSVEGLGGRLALLESLVKGLVPEADLSSNDEMQQLGKSLGIPLPQIDDAVVNIERSHGRHDEEAALPLLPDQQGQVQYIGPSSSFSFHLKLRKLIGNYSSLEFAMFGRNAAEECDISEISTPPKAGETNQGGQRTLSNASSNYGSPADTVKEIDSPVLDLLIDAYFDIIHADFPVLHEASFRESYEVWSASTSTANPVWLCGLLCVLILARRVASVQVPEEAEQKWWRHVQTLLPTVFFSSNLSAIQALMLVALHLHNTSHRDACWNITGTAIRIAYAIGLHRDDVKYVQSPLSRELRRQLWWTLYRFEQIQVSSYDRPTAIEHDVSSVGCPNERIVGGAGHSQDFTKWSQKLVLLLGSACKALNRSGSGNNAEDVYNRPLSPAAAVLRDLSRWKDDLPSHLRLEVMESLAPTSRRSLLLLHIQFHYIVTLLTRSALLRRATALAKDNNESLPQSLLTVSETCVDSGRSLGKLLRKLDSINKFNACTWFDIFYTVQAALVLVLDINCRVKQQRSESSTGSQTLLRDLASLIGRHLRDPRVPGSMQKWASVIIDVSSTSDQFTAAYQLQSITAPIQELSPTSTQPATVDVHSLSHTLADTQASSSRYDAAGQNEPFSPEDFNLIKENNQEFWAQLSFGDDANDPLQDWSWDDIESILRNSSTQPPVPENRRRLL